MLGRSSCPDIPLKLIFITPRTSNRLSPRVRFSEVP